MDVAADNVKPKIFWKDKPIFVKQIGNGILINLEKAKKILRYSEIKMKTKIK